MSQYNYYPLPPYNASFIQRFPINQQQRTFIPTNLPIQLSTLPPSYVYSNQMPQTLIQSQGGPRVLQAIICLIEASYFKILPIFQLIIHQMVFLI